MKISLLLSVALLVGATSLAYADDAMKGMTMKGMDMGHGEADAAYMKAMADMQKGMDAAKPTGDADKDFVLMMIPHHQGAVDMAKVELAHGKDKTLRRMAADVIKAQEAEIAEMKAWLAKHP
jgi:uncharacterized protein (DUF305 family)